MKEIKRESVKSLHISLQNMVDGSSLTTRAALHFSNKIHLQGGEVAGDAIIGIVKFKIS